MNLDDTLKDRQGRYGSYNEGCKLRAKILDDLAAHHKKVTGKEMTSVERVYFYDVILKLVRASGKIEYTDSWHDLAGYSKLIEEALGEFNVKGD